MLTRSPMTRAKPILGRPKAPRMRKCAAKGCQNRFAPRTTLHKFCGWECIFKQMQHDDDQDVKRQQKEERKKDAITREKLKSLSDWIKDVQVIFNRFIRLRDQLAGHQCISSGRVLNWTGNETDAGHFRSRGSAPHLRFNEDNCHAQSKKDNRYGAGNTVEYRIGLIKRIGIERVEALESDNMRRKYTVDELRVMKINYQAKIKELKERMT